MKKKRQCPHMNYRDEKCKGTQTLTPMADREGNSVGNWWRCTHCLNEDKELQKIDDPSGIVSKLVYESRDAVWETVVYRYQNRGVVCFSCQSGCPVGCVFCGTGKKYIRDLSEQEMLIQIEDGLKLIGERDKIEIMAMSMGEPMLNKRIFSVAKDVLSEGYYFYLSSVFVEDFESMGEILKLGKEFSNFGLQISLHSIDEKKRRVLLGNYEKLTSIEALVAYANFWKALTGKRVFFNYICNKNSYKDMPALLDLKGHHIALSVLCDTKELKQGERQYALRCAEELSKRGFLDYSIFDPAGQDTIGGGCGQLFYVQEKLKK